MLVNLGSEVVHSDYHFLGVDRFTEKFNPFVKDETCGVFLEITGDEKDFGLGPISTDLVDQLKSVKFGHHEVCYHKLKALTGLEQCKSFLAVFRLDHLVACLGKDSRKKLAGVGLVLNVLNHLKCNFGRGC